jgi:pyruvate/2-oxoglutarate dehydrogenase complex dihydrolipoamide acyltransferase (E2) component
MHRRFRWGQRRGNPSVTPREVTPVVRATAERLAVDLGSVRGTGVGGRITIADVNAAAPSTAPPPAAGHSASCPDPHDVRRLAVATVTALLVQEQLESGAILEEGLAACPACFAAALVLLAAALELSRERDAPGGLAWWALRWEAAALGIAI